MKYVRETVLLAFFSFLNLIIALTMNLWVSNTFDVIRDASNKTETYSQVNPVLNNLTTVFWLMFIFSAVGAIVLYLLKSHEEEYEEYTTWEE